MKFLSFSVLLLSFVAAAYGMSETYYLDDTFSLTAYQESTLPSRYINMQASADWINVKTGDYTFRIPYSEQWTLDRMKLPPVASVSTPNDDQLALSFGRYVSLGTFLIREYHLTVKGSDSADLIKSRTSNDCINAYDQHHRLLTPPPQKVRIGDIQAVTYLSGGAKGCATIVDFKLRNKWYTLSKIYPMGADDLSHSITPEMKLILTGIRS